MSAQMEGNTDTVPLNTGGARTKRRQILAVKLWLKNPTLLMTIVTTLMYL
jgi:hypothetical protein